MLSDFIVQFLGLKKEMKKTSGRYHYYLLVPPPSIYTIGGNKRGNFFPIQEERPPSEPLRRPMPMGSRTQLNSAWSHFSH